LRERALLLAVDLDGTFLGGSDAERAALYDLIASRRDEIALLFVTGRDIPFAAGLAQSGETPAPDMIIGDVGTSVVVGPEWTPHPATEAWIEGRWPGPKLAAEIMARRPKLKPQDVFGGRRLSYFYDDPAEVDAAGAEIEAAGYAALSSADLYFDVLPRGVNKGQTSAARRSPVGGRDPIRPVRARDVHQTTHAVDTRLPDRSTVSQRAI
jgi:hypothetical protein